MRRHICGIALVGIVLLTACGQQRIQVAETAGRTESDTVYEKMQEEQKKQKKSSPSSIREKETEMPAVIEKIPSDSSVPSMEPDPENYDLQLVFIGDETFGQNPDGTGIPELCMMRCKAHGYSLTADGTGAAVEDTEILGNERWKSQSLIGMVKAINAEINTGIFADESVQAVLSAAETDFSNTDYFIISYGLNDFRHGIPQNNEEYAYDWSITGCDWSIKRQISWCRNNFVQSILLQVLQRWMDDRGQQYV